jgi:hypothetical protein
MSDPKDFLARWSRRKLASADTNDAGEKIPSSAEARKDDASAPAVPAPDAEFDLSKLPSLESIGANSDITAFLQRGVPAGLTRAALRRAWSADPAIRDFVGLSENSWDFNAPDSIPGFGSLDASDVKRIAAQFFGEPSEEAVGHSLQNRNSLVQATSDAGESKTAPGHEMRTAALEESGISDDGKVPVGEIPDNKDNTPDVMGSAKQPERVGASQHNEQEVEHDSAMVHRRHGGSLPE